MATKKEERERMDHILRILRETYKGSIAGLDFTNAFELLVATILSAQCTDKQVNKVTPKLFADYPNAQAMAKLTAKELEPYVKSCGFYATKAKNIIATCNILVEEYDGQVPADIDEMQKLPGVGKKTANVVASNAFGIPAIAVDTHVFRVSNRLGLANAKNVEKTEEQLMKNIPREDWSDAHHWLIWHGREICSARKPKCEICPLTAYCRHYLQESRKAAKKETKT